MTGTSFSSCYFLYEPTSEVLCALISQLVACDIDNTLLYPLPYLFIFVMTLCQIGFSVSTFSPQHCCTYNLYTHVEVKPHSLQSEVQCLFVLLFLYNWSLRQLDPEILTCHVVVSNRP